MTICVLLLHQRSTCNITFYRVSIVYSNMSSDPELEEPLTWTGYYCAESIARDIIADPSTLQAKLSRGGVYTRKVYVANVARLDENVGHLFLCPPDYAYTIKFEHINRGDRYVRVFKPQKFGEKSNLFYVAHGVPLSNDGWPLTRVVQVDKPRVSQGKMLFQVFNALSGTEVGVYSFPIGSRVTCATLYPFIRRDLQVAPAVKAIDFILSNIR